jgi:hypothetical protein
MRYTPYANSEHTLACSRARPPNRSERSRIFCCPNKKPRWSDPSGASVSARADQDLGAHAGFETCTTHVQAAFIGRGLLFCASDWVHPHFQSGHYGGRLSDKSPSPRARIEAPSPRANYPNRNELARMLSIVGGCHSPPAPCPRPRVSDPRGLFRFLLAKPIRRLRPPPADPFVRSPTARCASGRPRSCVRARTPRPSNPTATSRSRPGSTTAPACARG